MATKPKAPPTKPTKPDLPLFSAAALPGDDDERWGFYRKVPLAKAMRVDGAFRVETSESENEPFLCEDGYLAVDSRGYPYAIAAAEFEAIYTPAVPVADPEPERPQTVVQAIQHALDTISNYQRIGEVGNREFALSKTALEDAQMRFTRGLAQRLDVFAPADLELIGADPAAASRFLADRDQKAHDAAQQES